MRHIVTVLTNVFVFSTGCFAAGNTHFVLQGIPSRGVLNSTTQTVVDTSCTGSASCIECTIIKTPSGKLLWATRDSVEMYLITDGPLHVYIARNGKGMVIVEVYGRDSIPAVKYTEICRAQPVIATYFGEGKYVYKP